MKLDLIKAFGESLLTDAVQIQKHRTIFNPKWVNHVYFGGRGSGKTKTASKAIIIEMCLRKVKVLVARERLNSVKDSIKSELEEVINELNLNHFFAITETKIKAKNGGEIIFKGLKNSTHNIKSIANVDIFLIEEAESISESSWADLLPSIRPPSGRKIGIIVFNPLSIDDSTYRRWVLNPPQDTISLSINYDDNPYFPKFLEQQRAYDKRTMSDSDYNRIWLGVPYSDVADTIVQRKWVNVCKDIKHVKGKVSVGYDPAGAGQDFHAISVMDGNQLVYIEQWQLSKDLREATHKAFDIALKYKADVFSYDECGGFGDGIAVFLKDYIKELNRDIRDNHKSKKVPKILAFNAGARPRKTSGNITYANEKARIHGLGANRFYQSFLAIDDKNVPLEDCISFGNEVNQSLLIKLCSELCTPKWVNSELSKRMVESKKDLKVRTGMSSPNLADSFYMAVNANSGIGTSNLSEVNTKGFNFKDAFRKLRNV